MGSYTSKPEEGNNNANDDQQQKRKRSNWGSFIGDYFHGGGGDDEHDDEHGNSNKRQKIEDDDEDDEDDEDAVPAVAADRYWEENNTYDILECHSASADSPASILSSEVANALFLTLAEKNGYDFAVQTLDSYSSLNEAKKLRSGILKLNGTWKVTSRITREFIGAEFEFKMNTNNLQYSECTLFAPGLNRGRDDDNGGIIFTIGRPTTDIKRTDGICFKGQYTNYIGDVDVSDRSFCFQPFLMVDYNPNKDKVVEYAFSVQLDNDDNLELEDINEQEKDRIERACRHYGSSLERVVVDEDGLTGSDTGSATIVL